MAQIVEKVVVVTKIKADIRMVTEAKHSIVGRAVVKNYFKELISAYFKTVTIVVELEAIIKIEVTVELAFVSLFPIKNLNAVISSSEQAVTIADIRMVTEAKYSMVIIVKMVIRMSLYHKAKFHQLRAHVANLAASFKENSSSNHKEMRNHLFDCST